MAGNLFRLLHTKNFLNFYVKYNLKFIKIIFDSYITQLAHHLT